MLDLKELTTGLVYKDLFKINDRKTKGPRQFFKVNDTEVKSKVLIYRLKDNLESYRKLA